MRCQISIGGQPIHVNPAYIFVPPELATAAEQLIANSQPLRIGETNQFTGRLEIVVDRYLSDTAPRYAAASGGMPTGLQHMSKKTSLSQVA